MTDPTLMYTLDNEDNLVYVRTIGAAVTNNAGDNLASVEAGAEVNTQDNRGCTALMRAAYGGYVDLVNYLLEHGADKELEDKDGNKAIHYVREHCLAELKPILK